MELERQSRHHNAINLQLENTVADAQNLLSHIEGVAEVEQKSDCEFLIFTQDGQMRLPEVVRFLDDKQWAVDTIHVEKGRLEDVFRQVTNQSPTQQPSTSTENS